MNDTTKQMTAQIPTGLGTHACGHDLGAISGRVVLSGIAGSRGTSTTGTPSSTVSSTVMRDRQDSVLALAEAFPGSPAWRPPIT
jgi:hypothetical protein